MIVTTYVGAAIDRPPTQGNTRYSFVIVEAENETEGALLAAQIVGSREHEDRKKRTPPDKWESTMTTVVMPVSTRVLEVRNS